MPCGIRKQNKGVQKAGNDLIKDQHTGTEAPIAHTLAEGNNTLYFNGG